MTSRWIAGVFLVLLVALASPLNASAQKFLTSDDSATLLAAVEDYNFSDYEIAIEKLENLVANYPENQRVLKYLGLCYEETGKFEEAVGIYFRWLSQGKLAFALEARFAHMGIAKSYIKLNRDNHAIKQLDNWLVFHPDDNEVLIMRAESLFRLKDYTKARSAWQKVAGLKGLKKEQKAAAHYYLSLIAYHLDETEERKVQGEAAIAVQPDGPYAEPARKLVEMRPKFGPSVSAAIEFFHTDNVELLPDYMPITDRDNSDVASRVSLSASYNFSSMGVSYRFNGTRYQKRSDFDLDTHILNFAVPMDDWVLSPRYEYANLSADFLYHGIGVDLNWREKQWSFALGGVYKEFNDAFSTDPNFAPTDLSYLNGLSASISGTRQGVIGDIRHYFSFGVSGESTKGNVTHEKAGNYLQLQLSGGATKALGEFTVGASANTHLRKYEAADPLANGLVREDTFLELKTFATWNPWENQQQFVLDISWQQNLSNYDKTNVPLVLAKEFEATKTALSWNYKW